MFLWSFCGVPVGKRTKGVPDMKKLMIVLFIAIFAACASAPPAEQAAPSGQPAAQPSTADGAARAEAAARAAEAALLNRNTASLAPATQQAAAAAPAAPVEPPPPPPEPVAVTAIPAWYTTGQLAGYGPNTHLIGVAEGATFQEAAQGAQVAIASQLRVTLQATVENFVRESNIDGRAMVEEEFTANSLSSIDETLRGAQIIEQAQFQGRYYAFAALNLQFFIDGLLLELADIRRQVDAYMTQARSEIAAGRIFSSIENYRNAYDELVYYYTQKGFVDTFAPSRSPQATLSPGEVVSEIRQVVGSLSVEVVSGNDQSGALGSNLSQPIVFRVVYIPTGGAPVPVPNLPLALRSGDNTSLGRSITNNQGQISVNAQAIPTQGDLGTVTASLDTRALLGGFSNIAQRAEVQARFTVVQPVVVPISVRVTAPDGQRMTRIEQAIDRELVSLGFRVTDDAPYLITGTLGVTGQQESSGLRGTQYLATVELNLRITNVGTNQVIGSAVFEGNGLSTTSPEDAVQSGFSRVTVNRRGMTNLMARVE